MYNINSRFVVSIGCYRRQPTEVLYREIRPVLLRLAELMGSTMLTVDTFCREMMIKQRMIVMMIMRVFGRRYSIA